MLPTEKSSQECSIEIECGEYNINIRPLRKSELALAVDAYGEMLKELNEKYQNPILPTRKTLAHVEYILDSFYDKGNHCFVACHNNIIIAYSLFFENVAIDLSYRMFHGLGLYVEDDYRKCGIGLKLIEITLDYVKGLGAAKFQAAFQDKNPSYKKVAKQFGFQQQESIQCLTF